MQSDPVLRGFDMDDLEIITRVSSRVTSTQKLNPTQLGVLEHPDRLKTKTQYTTADKLVEMGFLKKKTGLMGVFYDRTEEGQEYLNSLDDDKDDLTEENIREVWGKFPALVNPRVDIDRMCINLVIRDPAHGNTVVRTVKKVPSDKDVEKIVNDMLSDLKHRALKTVERWKYIPR